MKKKKQVNEKSKGVTINEFKAWLEGITAFQPEDWVPNADQWGKIREKIDNLIPEMVEKYAPPTQRPQMNQPGPQQTYNERPMYQAPPRAPMLAPLEPELSEPPPERLITKPPTVMTIDGKSMAVENKFKTPNINTETGYKSGFV